jgi:hypothetical protein
MNGPDMTDDHPPEEKPPRLRQEIVQAVNNHPDEPIGEERK